MNSVPAAYMQLALALTDTVTQGMDYNSTGTFNTGPVLHSV